MSPTTRARRLRNTLIPRLALAVCACLSGTATWAQTAAESAEPGWVAPLAGLIALGFALAWWRERRRRYRTALRLRGARQRERRMRELLGSAHVVGWEYAPESNGFSFVSEQIETLLGFSPQVWAQSGFWQSRLHPEDRTRVFAAYRNPPAIGQTRELDYRLLHADGRIVHVRDQLLPQSNGPLRGVLSDITRAHQRETDLCEREALFRALFEQAATGLAVLDADGYPQRANRRYCDISGYTEAELRRLTLAALSHPEDRAACERLFLELRDGRRETVLLEKRLLRADGRQVWVHATISPARLPGGSVSYIEAIQDVTSRRQAEASLRESEGRLRTILASMQEGVMLYDTEGRVVLANQAACRLLGLSEAEVARMRPHDSGLECYHEDGSRCTEADLPAHRARLLGEPRREILALRQRTGSELWLLVKAEPLVDDAGGAPYPVVATLSDITAHRRAEEDTRLAATVFDNSVEAIMITDAHRRILSVNRAFTEVTGYAAAEAIGRTPALLSSGHHDAEFYNRLWGAIREQGFWQGEIWNQRKNGKIFPEWLSISAVRDRGSRVTHYVALFSDITERKANEARIAFLAHHDPLTGLPNRTLLQDRLEQALTRANRESGRVALLFLDLDRFKTINDSLGHEAGDRLLQAVAERVRQCVRESDTVCRQGGDEFIIVLPDIHDAEAPARVAEKILITLSEPFQIDGQTLGTSFSIGIALYPDDGSDAASLMKNADTAMYHAKEAGRNTYRFFTEAMNANALERLNLENQLRRAIELGELLLHYQPQIDLASGRIVGAEALIRWHNPELGMVSPARFIPIAEDCGLIHPIGQWVLREACRQMRAWQAEGIAPIAVAVNLSALQFRRGDVVAGVRAVLDETGLAPELLELELTESLLMQHETDVLGTLQRLKALGVRLSIDDFGTGYSSFAYLKRFAVDRLKIDQSFVRDIAEDPDDAAIVRAIIQLGRSLKLEVIAEGAETSGQVDFLVREGCREAQGYYFCPPIPPEAFRRLLQERECLPAA